MARKIRRNDEVILLSGREKGKIGVVKTILSGNKILIEGINLVKKHQKPIPAQNQPGGIIEIESPIHISNVAILNTVTRKADRIGFKFSNGKKVRFFKSNGNIIK